MSSAPLFYPCGPDHRGHLRRKLSREPMTRGQAEQFLKTNFGRAWFNCNAIPVSVDQDSRLVY